MNLYFWDNFCVLFFQLLVFVPAFVELVHSSNGTTQKGTEVGNQQDNKTKRKKHTSKAEKKNVSIVPPHFIQTDTSCVKGETLIFSNCMFCIL